MKPRPGHQCQSLGSWMFIDPYLSLNLHVHISTQHKVMHMTQPCGVQRHRRGKMESKVGTAMVMMCIVCMGAMDMALSLMSSMSCPLSHWLGRGDVVVNVAPPMLSSSCPEAQEEMDGEQDGKQSGEYYRPTLIFPDFSLFFLIF